jgi:hypothetical protein
VGEVKQREHSDSVCLARDQAAHLPERNFSPRPQSGYCCVFRTPNGHCAMSWFRLDSMLGLDLHVLQDCAGKPAHGTRCAERHAITGAHLHFRQRHVASGQRAPCGLWRDLPRDDDLGLFVSREGLGYNNACVVTNQVCSAYPLRTLRQHLATRGACAPWKRMSRPSGHAAAPKTTLQHGIQLTQDNMNDATTNSGAPASTDGSTA